MNKFTALLLLCFASQISARCFLGVCTDKCQDNAPKAGQCAILFDEPKCNSEKFIVADNGKSDIEVSEDLEEDAESIAVRRGCTLEVFNDDDCTGKSFTFSARNDKDLFIKDIEDGDDDDYEDEGLDFVDTDDLDDFEEEIKCVKCTCGGNSRSGLKKGNSGFFGGIKDAALSSIGLKDGLTGSLTGLVKSVLNK